MIVEVKDKNSGAILFKKDPESVQLEELVERSNELLKRVSALEKQVKRLENKLKTLKSE